jgi:hypothetical protein
VSTRSRHRIRHRATLVALGALLASAPLLLTWEEASGAADSSDETNQVFDLNGNPVEVGSVVAQLTPTSDGCMGTEGVQVTGTASDPGPDVSLALTKDCQVIVTGITPSSEGEGSGPPTDEGGSVVTPTEVADASGGD